MRSMRGLCYRVLWVFVACNCLAWFLVGPVVGLFGIRFGLRVDIVFGFLLLLGSADLRLDAFDTLSFSFPLACSVSLRDGAVGFLRCAAFSKIRIDGISMPDLELPRKQTRDPPRRSIHRTLSICNHLTNLRSFSR